ncbi:hypothetical protein Tco_1480830, partial [Tanacetum coccineum]
MELSQLRLQHEVGSGNRSGGGGDDESGDEEYADEDEDDEDSVTGASRRGMNLLRAFPDIRSLATCHWEEYPHGHVTGKMGIMSSGIEANVVVSSSKRISSSPTLRVNSSMEPVCCGILAFPDLWECYYCFETMAWPSVAFLLHQDYAYGMNVISFMR